MDLAGELKKNMEHECDGDTDFNWCARYNHQGIHTGMGELVNKGMYGNYQTTALLRPARILKKVLET